MFGVAFGGPGITDVLHMGGNHLTFKTHNPVAGENKVYLKQRVVPVIGLYGEQFQRLFLFGQDDILAADFQDVIKMQAGAYAATGCFLVRKDIAGIRATVFPDITVQHHDKAATFLNIGNIAHHGDGILQIGGQDSEVFDVFGPEF